MISIEIFSWVVKVILEASHSVRREITNMKYLKKKREKEKRSKSEELKVYTGKI